jgi:hypothetical protein
MATTMILKGWFARTARETSQTPGLCGRLRLMKKAATTPQNNLLPVIPKHHEVRNEYSHLGDFPKDVRAEDLRLVGYVVEGLPTPYQTLKFRRLPGGEFVLIR